MNSHLWDTLEPMPELAGCYATLGNFDGVHLGHQALLADLVAWAASSPESDRPTVAITFREHPRHVLGDARPQTIIPFDRRLELMAESGLQHTVVIPFTREFSMVSAEGFVERVLVEGLGARGVLLGWNSFFGHNRRGNLAYLEEHGPRFGLDVRGQDPILVDHAPISSSRIRHAMLEGDLGAARKLLGRAPTITGLVVAGDGRGRELGFPTANIAPQQDVVPPGGVYLCAALLPGRPPLPALTNIGARPTFAASGEAAPSAAAGHATVETWIQGLDENLYGQRLTIQVLERVRDEQRFTGLAELVAAIQADQRALADYVASGREPFS